MVPQDEPVPGLRELSQGLALLNHHLGGLGVADAAEGRSEGLPWLLRGPHAMTVKHLTQSVKEGRKITLYPPDLEEITGFVTGWDDLSQAAPRIFVIVFPGGSKPAERWLVPYSETTPVRLHDDSTAPQEGEPYYDDYERVVRPFKTFVLNRFFGPTKKSQHRMAG